MQMLGLLQCKQNTQYFHFLQIERKQFRLAFSPKIFSTQINSAESFLSVNPTTPESLTYTLARPRSRSSSKVQNGLKALVSCSCPLYHKAPSFPTSTAFAGFQIHPEVVMCDFKTFTCLPSQPLYLPSTSFVWDLAIPSTKDPFDILKA